MLSKLPLLKEFLQGDTKLRMHSLEDYADRLHYFVTVHGLALCAVLIGSKQHFGNPIDCFIPKHQGQIGSWHDFILNYCFVSGTRAFDPHYGIVQSNKTVDDNPIIQYYQWIPFFLTFQLCCFMLPCWFWSWAQSLLYIDMSVVVTEAVSLKNTHLKMEYERKNKELAEYIYENIQRRQSYGIGRRWRFRPPIGTVLYAVTKILYMVNAVVQFFVVTAFLGIKDWKWGLEYFYHMVFGNRVSQDSRLSNEFYSLSPYFPLQVLCEYTTVGAMSQAHTYQIQCLLTLNFINEKIFVAFWFWFLFLMFISTASLAAFLMQINCGQYRRRTMTTILRDAVANENINISFRHSTTTTAHIGNRANAMPIAFADDLLSLDGLLLVQFIQMKAGTITTRKIVQTVYEKYLNSSGLLSMHSRSTLRSLRSLNSLNNDANDN